MKKRIKTGTQVAVLCAVAALGGVYAFGNGAYADAGSQLSISVYDGTTSCYIYDASYEADCDASYGSYNIDTSTLTLGTGVNGKSVRVSDLSNPGNSYVIKSTADISASLSTPSYATITFDLGEYSWTQNDSESSYLSMPTYGTTIMKSGTLNLISQFTNYNLQIDGGTINTNAVIDSSDRKEMTTGDVKAETFVMNGGVLNMKNGELEINNASINDGELMIENPYGLGGVVSVSGSGDVDFNLNGGSVTIDAKGMSKSGIDISSYNNGNVTVNINGGVLNIKNTETGISAGGVASKNTKINFNGGVSTFKDSSRYAIKLDYSDDPENAIAFGEDMGIVEPNLYVFWVDENYYEGERGQAGIVAENTLTIAEGGTVRRYYGWEIGDGDGEDESELEVPNTDKSSPKTPDTGVFSGEGNNGIVAMISLGLLALVSGVAYVAGYIVKRCRGGVRFQK